MLRLSEIQSTLHQLANCQKKLRMAQDLEYEVGQRLWVFSPTRQKGLYPKLMSQWHGPFRIIKKISQVHFHLRTLDNELVTTNYLCQLHETAQQPR